MSEEGESNEVNEGVGEGGEEVNETPQEPIEPATEEESKEDSILKILNGMPKQPDIEPLNYTVPEETEDAYTTATTLAFVSPVMFQNKMTNVYHQTNVLDQRVSYLEKQQTINQAVMLAMDTKLHDILGPLFDKLNDKVNDMILNAETKIADIVEKVEKGGGGVENAIDNNVGEEDGIETSGKEGDNRPKSVQDQINDIYNKIEILENNTNNDDMEEKEFMLKKMKEDIETVQNLRETDHKEFEDLNNKLTNNLVNIETNQSESNNQILSMDNQMKTLEGEHSQFKETTKEDLDALKKEMELRLSAMLEESSRLTTEARAGVAAAIDAAGQAADKAKHMNKQASMQTEEGLSSLQSHVLNVENMTSRHQIELKFLHKEIDHLNADHHHHDKVEFDRIDRVNKTHNEVTLNRKKNYLPSDVVDEEEVKEEDVFARPGFLVVLPKNHETGASNTGEGNNGGVQSAGIRYTSGGDGNLNNEHIHHVAVADPLEVEEHRKLLRALVKKVNAQGRCLQSLVSEVKVLDDRKAKMKKLQKDGIAVQCLSCLRPTNETLPRLTEGNLPGGQRSQPNEFSEFVQSHNQDQTKRINNQNASNKNSKSVQRPKSAGRKRPDSSNRDTSSTPFPLNTSQSLVHSKDQPLMRGSTGGTGGGIYKVIDGQPMTAAVSQYFPAKMNITAIKDVVDDRDERDERDGGRLTSALLTDDLYNSLDESDMDRFGGGEERKDHQNTVQRDRATIHIQSGAPVVGEMYAQDKANLSPRARMNRPQSAPVNRRQPQVEIKNEEGQTQPIDQTRTDEGVIEDKWKTEEELDKDEGWDKLI